LRSPFAGICTIFTGDCKGRPYANVFHWYFKLQFIAEMKKPPGCKTPAETVFILYPSATSRTIISVKPTAKKMVPMLECSPSDISGISSSTTTYSMAPAENASR